VTQQVFKRVPEDTRAWPAAKRAPRDELGAVTRRSCSPHYLTPAVTFITILMRQY
jgi:hypothetical protein